MRLDIDYFSFIPTGPLHKLFPLQTCAQTSCFLWSFPRDYYFLFCMTAATKRDVYSWIYTLCHHFFLALGSLKLSMIFVYLCFSSDYHSSSINVYWIMEGKKEGKEQRKEGRKEEIFYLHNHLNFTNGKDTFQRNVQNWPDPQLETAVFWFQMTSSFPLYYRNLSQDFSFSFPGK